MWLTHCVCYIPRFDFHSNKIFLSWLIEQIVFTPFTATEVFRLNFSSCYPNWKWIDLPKRKCDSQVHFGTHQYYRRSHIGEWKKKFIGSDFDVFKIEIETYVPFRRARVKFQCHQKFMTISTCNLIFHLRWMRRIFATGVKRPIEDDDVYAVPHDLQCEKSTLEFANLWNLELKKSNPSIFRVIFKLYYKLILIGTIFATFETIAK